MSKTRTLEDGNIWKAIKGYGDKFQVSNNGLVRHINNHFVATTLGQRVNKEGFLTVTFRYVNKNIVKKVHLLVAEAFLPNPNRKPIVLHINGNKTHNYPKNLKWVTRKELMEIKAIPSITKMMPRDQASIRHDEAIAPDKNIG